MHDVPMGRRRVLVVDDNAAIRRLLRLFFEQEGYDVETTATGTRALERFGAGRFHLVIVAYYLPEINGLEVASAIRGCDPEVPIALITGMAHILVNVDVASAGITKMFSKPFALAEISQWLYSLPDAP